MNTTENINEILIIKQNDFLSNILPKIPFCENY